MPLTRKLAAEFLGTFWLVLGGCVSLAFGLTVVTMAFAIGHVSGCHLNPAVTFGLVLGGRHSAKEMLPYWIVQVLGAIFAAQVLVFIAGGNGTDPLAGGLAANGFGEHSPGNYSMAAGFVSDHRQTGARGIRAFGHRPCAYSHPLDQHSRHQHFGQSGAQHRSGGVHSGLGAVAAMALLGGATIGRRDRRIDLSLRYSRLAARRGRSRRPRNLDRPGDDAY
jgi:hypothetical protein